eukprot:4396796-Prymnesium_polylepis.1
MSQWLRGAGGVEPSRGVEFQPADDAAIGQVEQCDEESSGRVPVGRSGRVQAGRIPSWARECPGGCYAGGSLECAAVSAGAGLA